jgi:mRNA-degrading endonuclease RelE of RelBE toxin-antitoxin system
VRYRIDISDKAREQLRGLPKEIRRNIGHRIEAMRNDLREDVLQLRTKAIAIAFVSALIVFSSFWQET